MNGLLSKIAWWTSSILIYNKSGCCGRDVSEATSAPSKPSTDGSIVYLKCKYIQDGKEPFFADWFSEILRSLAEETGKVLFEFISTLFEEEITI